MTSQPTPHSDSELSDILWVAYKYGFERAQKGLSLEDGYLKDEEQLLVRWADRRAEKLVVEARGGPDRYQEYPYRFYGGEKVKFASEKQRYTVRCASKRYAICTKPFNAQKTVLYTIIDQWRNIRAPENLVFGIGAETDIECLEMLVRLLDNESEPSYRHEHHLDIEAVYDGNKIIAPTEQLEPEEDDNTLKS